MHDTLHFANPPIQEAIVDFDAPSSGGLTRSSFEKSFRDHIPSDAYPDMIPMYSRDFRFTAKHAESMEVEAEDPNWIGAQVTSADKRQVIRFRLNGFSFHRLAPYDSFEAVRPELEKYWQVFLSLAKPQSVCRTSLRYINRIQLPEEVVLSQLKEYVKVLPPLAISSEVDTDKVMSRIQFRKSGSNLGGVVTFSLATAPSIRPVVAILDVNVWSERNCNPVDSSVLGGFDNLRTLRDEIFTGSLTKKCLTLFSE